MKKFLTAALMLAACGSQAQQIKATPEEVSAALGRPGLGIRVLAWHEVDLRKGSECVFALTESNLEQGVSILERRNGRLSVFYNSPTWYGRRAESAHITDKGNDGKKEVEVRLNDGRRVYYLWSGDRYKGEDALAYHGMTGHEKIRDDVFYRDLDGDGVEEALIVFAHDFSGPFGPTTFDARRWDHGWGRPYENDYLKQVRKDYESAAKSGMDALALNEKKHEIREKLRHYAQR